MATIIPQIYKSKLPKALRWPLKYADVAACFAAHATDDVYLDVHFSDTNLGYAASGAGGPPSDHASDALALVTLRHDPDNIATLFRDPRTLPAEAILVEVVVWALPRASSLIPLVHREPVRDALRSELAALAGVGRELFRERWVLQLRARPEPERLESLSTVWTGIRREETHRRTMPLRTDTRTNGPR